MESPARPVPCPTSETGFHASFSPSRRRQILDLPHRTRSAAAARAPGGSQPEIHANQTASSSPPGNRGTRFNAPFSLAPARGPLVECASRSMGCRCHQERKTGSNAIKSGQKEWEGTHAGKATVAPYLDAHPTHPRGYRQTASLLHWNRTAPRRFNPFTDAAGCP